LNYSVNRRLGPSIYTVKYFIRTLLATAADCYQRCYIPETSYLVNWNSVTWSATIGDLLMTSSLLRHVTGRRRVTPRTQWFASGLHGKQQNHFCPSAV